MERIVRRTLFTILFFLVLILILLWGVTPHVARTALTDFFSQHGASFEAESISVNPFLARVTANKVTVIGKRQREFEFASFAFELDLLPLLERKVNVVEIKLDGLHIEVEEQKDAWYVAGIAVEKAQDTDQETAKETDETAPESDAESSSAPWIVQLPDIEFTNATINISRLNPEKTDERFKDNVKLNRLAITKTVGEALDWSGAVALSAAINGATVDLETEFKFKEGNLRQWVDIKLLTANLKQFAHYVPAPINQGSLYLTLVGEVVVDYNPAEIVLTTQTKQLELDRVSLPVSSYLIESEQLQLDIDTLQAQIPSDGSSPSLRFEGKFGTKKTQINEGPQSQLLASWDEFSIEPIDVFFQDNTIELEVNKVASSNLKGSQVSTPDGPLPALVNLGSLLVEDIKFADNSVKINNIRLEDLDSHVLLDKSRNLTTLALPSTASADEKSEGKEAEEQKDTDEKAASEDASEQSDPLVFVLNQFELTGDSKVEFADRGVSPAFNQTLAIQSLVIEGINTSKPDQATHITFEGKTSKYSSIKTDTRVWPFKEKLSADTRTELAEITLPPLSPYLEDALGYNIDSGQLDMDLVLTIEQGVLDGNTKMHLRRFDLGSGDDPSTNKVEEKNALDPDLNISGAIPLNVAVGMLKDDDENIELNIPITGDMDSPEFGLQNFAGILFRKALFEATTSYVVKTFVPYANILTVAKFAGDQLLKVRVAPLVYPPQIINPKQSASEFVTEFQKLMKEKEDIQVKACAFATPADLGDEIPAELTKEQIDALSALAKQRGEAFKDAVLAGTDIQSSRILLCKPKVELEKKKQGRIEFEI